MTSLKCLLATLLLLAVGGRDATSASKLDTPGTNGAAKLIATVEPLKSGDNTAAVLRQEDVQVSQSGNRVPVTGWTPCRGERAGLQLFIVLDEASDNNIGFQFEALRAFIQAEPATTWIALGYMQNVRVDIVQNFTTDHAQVVKALRMPLGTVGKSDSPYLSLIGLMKGWRGGSDMRREVLIITDGIDRVAGSGSSSVRWSPRAAVRDMPYQSPDVDTASQDAQRLGIIIHTIYTPGVGRVGRNYNDSMNGQKGLAKVADETGGESFYSGLGNTVSFKLYLDRLQAILDNQYFLTFQPRTGKKAGLQRVKVSTEVPGVEIVTADNVWVGEAAQSGEK